MGENGFLKLPGPINWPLMSIYLKMVFAWCCRRSFRIDIDMVLRVYSNSVSFCPSWICVLFSASCFSISSKSSNRFAVFMLSVLVLFASSFCFNWLRSCYPCCLALFLRVLCLAVLVVYPSTVRIVVVALSFYTVLWAPWRHPWWWGLRSVSIPA